MATALRTPKTARFGECAADRPCATGSERGLDPALVGLLDHLACELAQEYVRLMEEAASEAAPSAKEGSKS